MSLPLLLSSSRFSSTSSFFTLICSHSSSLLTSLVHVSVNSSSSFFCLFLPLLLLLLHFHLLLFYLFLIFPIFFFLVYVSVTSPSSSSSSVSSFPCSSFCYYPFLLVPSPHNCLSFLSSAILFLIILYNHLIFPLHLFFTSPFHHLLHLHLVLLISRCGKGLPPSPPPASCVTGAKLDSWQANKFPREKVERQEREPSHRGPGRKVVQ